MISDFPKHTGLVYFTDESTPPGPQTRSEKVKSGFSLSIGSNRLTANDLPNAKRATSYAYGSWMGADSYIANTYVDYTLLCQDDYADPLPNVIHLNIKDVNSAPTKTIPEDDFFTWAEAP